MPKAHQGRQNAHQPHILPGQPHGPAVTITRRAADRLREGHLWVYRSDVTALIPREGEEAITPGALVTVADNRNIPLGTGLYSSASEIAVRIVSSEAALTRKAFLAQTRERLNAALDLRRALSRNDVLSPDVALSSEDANNNASRLIFSEADNLPGIIADRYNDLVILQLLTQGTAQHDVRDLLTATIKARFGDGITTIVERPDPRIRELEQLEAPSPEPLYSSTTTPKLQTTFTINGLHFHYDAQAGQKTGAFLDQRLNYAAAARHARGAALDICTYQGGFALHLAQHAGRVTGVDASRAALEVADRNLALNPNLRAETDWIEADAFELLREYDATSQKYDTIVLDPPAFAKSKRAVEGALRGYKELNLRAIRMLSSAGTLITCSCSHHVSREAFQYTVAAAAADAGRRVQLLELHGAAPDHPEVLTLPETAYLKCLICRVD